MPLGNDRARPARPGPSAFLIGSPIPGLRSRRPRARARGRRPGRSRPADRPRRQPDPPRRPPRQGGLDQLLGELVPALPVRDADPAHDRRSATAIGASSSSPSRSSRRSRTGRSYADRYDLEYTIGADVTGAIFHAYRVFALPTQFFIDPDGVIRQIVNGPLDRGARGAARRVDPSAGPDAGANSHPGRARDDADARGDTVSPKRKPKASGRRPSIAEMDALTRDARLVLGGRGYRSPGQMLDEIPRDIEGDLYGAGSNTTEPRNTCHCQVSGMAIANVLLSRVAACSIFSSPDQPT